MNDPVHCRLLHAVGSTQPTGQTVNLSLNTGQDFLILKLENIDNVVKNNDHVSHLIDSFLTQLSAGFFRVVIPGELSADCDQFTQLLSRNQQLIDIPVHIPSLGQYRPLFIGEGNTIVGHFDTLLFLPWRRATSSRVCDI